eukprot:scaffold12580_cov55-Attheya_sp.AAC.7
MGDVTVHSGWTLHSANGATADGVDIDTPWPLPTWTLVPKFAQCSFDSDLIATESSSPPGRLQATSSFASCAAMAGRYDGQQMHGRRDGDAIE